MLVPAEAKCRKQFVGKEAGNGSQQLKPLVAVEFSAI